MELFRYRVALADGSIRTEEAPAEDLVSLQTGLEKKGFLVLDIHPRRRGWKTLIGFLIPRGGRRVSARALLNFTQEMLELLRAGLPLVECLSLLAEQNDHTAFQPILREIRKEIISGSALSDALARKPEVFSNLYVSSVRSGEKSGRLVETLSRYIGFQSSMLELRSRVVTSLSYPAFLFTVSLFLIIFLISYVLPTFSTMYSDFKAPLPAGTLFLLEVSGFIQNWAFPLLGALIAGGLGIRQAYRTGSGRRLIDGVLIHLPLFGPMLRRYNTAILTRTLATVLSGGIPLIPGLSMVRESLSNRAMAEGLDRVIEEVRAGGSLAGALHRSGLLPRVVDRMVGVGEASGSLERMLDHAAAYQEQEINNRLSRMTSLLEPVMMLVLGAIIGVVVIMIYLPIFSVMEVVR